MMKVNVSSPLYDDSKKRYSPWFDMNEYKETGEYHEWAPYNEGDYYGPTHKCMKCGKMNKGWNLWNDDFLPDCIG
jgi:hypothetical protein